MMLTIPPVVYGIFRYLYLIYDRSDDRSTAAIVAEDKGMIAAGATFALVAFLLLYVFRASLRRSWSRRSGAPTRRLPGRLAALAGLAKVAWRGSTSQALLLAEGRLGGRPASKSAMRPSPSSGRRERKATSLHVKRSRAAMTRPINASAAAIRHVRWTDLVAMATNNVQRTAPAMAR